MTTATSELEVFGIYDRGIANHERIAIRVNRPVTISNYALLMGVESEGGNLVPFRDHFLWLGHHTFDVPSWIFVYTGEGTQKISQETHTKDPVLTLYWNHPNVMFSDSKTTIGLIYIPGYQKSPQIPKPATDAVITDQRNTSELVLQQLSKLLEESFKKT